MLLIDMPGLLLRRAQQAKPRQWPLGLTLIAMSVGMAVLVVWRM